MPFKVGGVIPARTNRAPSNAAPTAAMTNILAFETGLTKRRGPNWARFYGFVKPWDGPRIKEYVFQLCDAFDPTRNDPDSVQVIVVSGTTLGEKVKQYRAEYATTNGKDPAKSKIWIVMATDDGDWTATFTPSNYDTELVTGTTSGYSRAKPGQAKTLTRERAESALTRFQDDNPSTVIVPAILRANDGELSGHAKDEKSSQETDIVIGTGAALGGYCLITRTDNMDGTTTFGFSEGGNFRTANVLFILGDAVTFLARPEIQNKLANTSDWRSFLFVSGPHRGYQSAGATITYGPRMDGKTKHGRYYEAADWVADILGGNVPKPPKGSLTKFDVEELI